MNENIGCELTFDDSEVLVICPTCGEKNSAVCMETCVICQTSGCMDCIGDWRGESIHLTDCGD